MLVGARPDVLKPVRDAANLLIDLDTERYRDPQALTRYVHQLLVAAKEPDVRTPYQPAIADPGRTGSDGSGMVAAAVAAEIAERATAWDNGPESFLFARLLALSIRHRPTIVDVNDSRWRTQLPASVGATIEDDLTRRLGERAAVGRVLLTALAWACGPGLPWENLWVPVARALAAEGAGAGQPHLVSNQDVRWLLRTAGSYIVEDLGPGGRSVFRPFHHLLATHLRGEPNNEQAAADPAAADAWEQRRARTERRITGALLATVPVDSQGRRDWPSAHPYLWTYLYEHAEAAGPETADAVANLVSVSPVLGRWFDAAQQAWSFFNTQPWSFRICAADRIELRANRGERDGVDRGHWDRWLRAGGRHYLDPLARVFTISCGAALFNLRLAIGVTGRDLAVHLLPDLEHDSTLLATVQIETRRIKAPTIWEQELYEAIWRCHTNEWPYTIVPVPLPVIVAMEHAAAQEGVYLRLLKNRQARKWMKVAAEADRELAAPPPSLDINQRDVPYREWLERWTGSDDSEVGVPAANFGPPPANRYPRTRKDFWRDDEKRRFERNPQLMALSTDDDKPLDWLRAGQALQRAILTGARYSVSGPYGLAPRYHAPTRPRYGVSVSFLTQPLERDDIAGVARRWPWRSRYAEVPQVVMRVGYAAVPTPAAPRLQPDVVDARSEPPRSTLPPDAEAGDMT